MWGFAIALAIWMMYVEVEMPNRTEECPFNEYACEEEESENEQ